MRLSEKKRVAFLHLADYKFPIWRISVMAQALIKGGYDVHVICIRPNSTLRENINGVNIWNVNAYLNKTKELLKLNRFHRYMRFLIISNIMKNILWIIKPQAVHIFNPLLIPMAVKLKKHLDFKLLYDCYEPWIQASLGKGRIHSGIIYYIIHKIFNSYIDGVTTVYKENPILKFFRDKPQLWFPNLSPIYKMDNSYLNINDLKNIKKKFFIGYLGVITPYKGYETAIKAMSYLDDDYRLLCVGAWSNEKIKSKLLKLVNDLNLDDKIIFTGKLESTREILEYARKFDVGLLIPDNTAWQKNTLPVKLFDYIKLGLPIIASELPNLKKFAKQYRIGCIFIPPKNPKVLAETIRRIKKDYKLKKYLETQNVLATKYFKIENFEDLLISFYNSIL